MPFQIVRNDIVNMQVDAIVNTTNPTPAVGYGVDLGIHLKAGPQLLEARKELGVIPVGGAGITEGFDLPARYVIHTVCPVWQGGDKGETELLSRCYTRSMTLAVEGGCTSIAFPLMSAGNHGFPKPTALQTAVDTISRFLMEHDLTVYLVVFSKNAYALSEKLFHAVESSIDEHYIEEKKLSEYGYSDKCTVRELQTRETRRWQERRSRRMAEQMPYLSEIENAAPAPKKAAGFSMDHLRSMLAKQDAGFSETLLQLIDRSGKTDAEVYKKANIDRKLFSKIRTNPTYRPTKPTALAFAIALELNMEDTELLLERAGYALSHASKFDIIVEYFIRTANYDIFQLNAVLFEFDQPLIGG